MVKLCCQINCTHQTLSFAINVYETSFLHHKVYILRIDRGANCPIASVNKMRFLQLHAKSFKIGSLKETHPTQMLNLHVLLEMGSGN